MEKTIWSLSREKDRVPMMDVYSAVLAEAKRNREEAKRQRGDDTAQHTYKELCDEVANALYSVCAALENTNEINPKK